jgi:hypothetical protein
VRQLWQLSERVDEGERHSMARVLPTGDAKRQKVAILSEGSTARKAANGIAQH